MRLQNSKRSLFIGAIVWLLFFGWWFRGFLFKNWHFRLFSFKSWKHLIDEFKAGWQISSKSDWIFIFSFILAPVIFGLLWYWAQKVKWHRVGDKIWKALRGLFLIPKKKKLKKAVSVYEPKAPIEPVGYRPQAMPRSPGRLQQPTEILTPAFLNNSTAMPNFGSPPSESFIQPKEEFSFSQKPVAPQVEPFTNEAFAEMANTPLSDIQIPKMEPVSEDVGAVLEGAGYTLLPPVPVGGQAADFVAASAQEILLILYDKEKGDWLADEESFNDEDPLWFSETDHRISPVFQLKGAAAKLQQKLGELMPVHPVLIERDGTIINAEDMMKTWNDLGVVVCRTGEGGSVELPTCTEVFHKTQEKVSPETLEKIKEIL
ncbi:MAG: hypothetical protein ACI4OR_02365 [Alphaproteobacteria bacterium]